MGDQEATSAGAKWSGYGVFCIAGRSSRRDTGLLSLAGGRFPKALAQINEGDLNALIGTEETARMDFKGELPKAHREASQRFLSDICAFANTEGDDLIYGLEQDDEGSAARLVGQVVNPDAEVMRL